jgi:hypothetical protein
VAACCCPVGRGTLACPGPATGMVPLLSTCSARCVSASPGWGHCCCPGTCHRCWPAQRPSDGPSCCPGCCCPSAASSILATR